MTLKIEEGKFYKSRSGRIFGPMVKHERSGGWTTTTENKVTGYWMYSGVCFFVTECDVDLVEEHYDQTNWLEEGKHYLYKKHKKAKCLLVLPNNRAVIQIWRAPVDYFLVEPDKNDYYISEFSVKNTEGYFTEISPVYKESSNEN